MINEKPWGWYQTMDAGSSYKVKRIFVNPESRFSLQYHNHREEFWTIVEGSGYLTRGDKEYKVKPGDSCHIPVQTLHRMEGGQNGVLFIEVQRGECYEEDIVRLEDDYGRVDN